MEFFLFAGLIALDIIFFIFLAVRYKYVESEKPKEESISRASTSTPTGGTDNQAFTADTQI